MLQVHFCAKLSLIVLVLNGLSLTPLARSNGNGNHNRNRAQCDGPGWVPYRDEKCFKLVKSYASFDEAVERCALEEIRASDHVVPHLATIRSETEQRQLVDYLFTDSGVKVHVWFGAQRDPRNASHFRWQHDHSAVEWTNWANDSPTDSEQRNCVVLQSDLMRRHELAKLSSKRTLQTPRNSTNQDVTNDEKGQWRDITCESGNYFVCEKSLPWTMNRIQQLLLEMRTELTASVSALASEVTNNAELVNAIEADQKVMRTELNWADYQLQYQDDLIKDNTRALTTLQEQMRQTQSDLFRVNLTMHSLIPSGFVYVQLPDQPEPKDLWTHLDWVEVTNQYEGRVLRVKGTTTVELASVLVQESSTVLEVRIWKARAKVTV